MVIAMILNILSDDMLTKALSCARDLQLDLVEKSIEREHMFSDGFEKKMHKLVEAEKKVSYPFTNSFWKRAAIIILAILTFGMVTVMSVEALRTGLFEMIEEIYEKYSQISYHQLSDEPIEDEVFIEYQLGYIPIGYELVESYIDEITQIKTAVYSNGEKIIRFRQTDIRNSSFMINTENAEREVILIEGIEMNYLSNQGVQTIFWGKEKYAFIISGEIDKELIIKLAQEITAK